MFYFETHQPQNPWWQCLSVLHLAAGGTLVAWVSDEQLPAVKALGFDLETLDASGCALALNVTLHL